VIKDQSLLAALEQAPVFGYDLNFGAWAAIRLWSNLYTSVEEAASRASGFLIANVYIAAIAGMNSDSCIESHKERKRPASVSKTVRVGRARWRLGSSSHDQPVVRAITVHGERDCTRFDVRVRDLIDVDA